MRELIAPIVLSRGRALVEDHRRRNHCLAIVTSTNAFITRPIADLLGIEHLLATEPEFDGQRYTGNYLGEPCSGAGKVQWVNEWAGRNGLSLAGVKGDATVVVIGAVLILAVFVNRILRGEKSDAR